MNRFKYLAMTTIGLTFAGFAAVSFASNISATCESYFIMPSSQFNQIASSSSTASMLGQCVQQNVCADIYSNPKAISTCASVLKVRDYQSNFQYYNRLFSERSGASQSSYGQSYNPGTNPDVNTSNANNQANNDASNKSDFNAAAAHTNSSYVAPISPSASSDTNNTSSDTGNSGNANDNNTQNSIRWF